VTREDQLQWEARWGRPAGIAALAAALLFLVSGFVFPPKDREGIEPYPDALLSIDQNPGAYTAYVVLPVIGSLLVMGVFYYLFRATEARGGSVPRWFLYIVLAGPVLYAVSQVLFSLELRDLAEEFADGGPIRGEAGEDRAEDTGDFSPVVEGLRSAGVVSLAFVYVMLPLRARRVGLVSPFLSILGVIVGVLIVFATLGIGPVIQAFWLGAIGMLLLGNWPGGRGPAWESGEAEPWPSAAQRRGLVPMPGEEPELDPDAAPPEPEPVPERPASRKRRKKR
jgi:small-conductance mechanosensitive channel